MLINLLYGHIQLCHVCIKSLKLLLSLGQLLKYRLDLVFELLGDEEFHVVFLFLLLLLRAQLAHSLLILAIALLLALSLLVADGSPRDCPGRRAHLHSKDV